MRNKKPDRKGALAPDSLNIAPVSNKTMTKAETLNKLIDDIPGICTGGREGIRNLIAEITGVQLVNIKPPEPSFHVGQQIMFNGITYLLTGTGSDANFLMAIDINTGKRCVPSFRLTSSSGSGRVAASELMRALGCRSTREIDRVRILR